MFRYAIYFIKMHIYSLLLDITIYKAGYINTWSNIYRLSTYAFPRKIIGNTEIGYYSLVNIKTGVVLKHEL